MKKKIKMTFLLLLVVIPLLACTNYKKVTNTKKLTNYEYTLTKTIQIDDQKEEVIEEHGYVNDSIEKRNIKINDKEFTTYFENSKNGTFIYKQNKDGEYIKDKLPCNKSSYLNMIDKDWFSYENGNIVLNKEANTKILRMLHIHKYLVDDIKLNNIDYKENDKYITNIDITFDLLKGEEKVGTASIEFNIVSINNVQEITLPNLK